MINNTLYLYADYACLGFNSGGIILRGISTIFCISSMSLIKTICQWNGINRFRPVSGRTVSAGTVTGFWWNSYRFKPVIGGTVPDLDRFPVKRLPIHTINWWLIVTVAPLIIWEHKTERNTSVNYYSKKIRYRTL